MIIIVEIEDSKVPLDDIMDILEDALEQEGIQGQVYTEEGGD